MRGVFVGSIAKGRMLLEVIGIKLATNGQIQDVPNIKREKSSKDLVTTSVYSNNLRGKMANVILLKEQVPDDMEKLRHYLIAANKYELHLTIQNYERDLELYNQAIPVILRLIDDHVYKANSENLLIRETLMKENRTFAESMNF
jgi:hypothetical protein